MAYDYSSDTTKDASKTDKSDYDDQQPASELEEELRKKAEQAKNDTIEHLAQEISDKFFTRANNRVGKEQEWLESSRLYMGNLALRGGIVRRPFDNLAPDTRPTINIVRRKTDDAIAQAVSLQFGAGEKNWDVLPSPDDPDPEAETKAEKMSRVMQAQLARGYYARECRRALEQRTILGTGVMKGPTNTGRAVTTYTPMIQPDGSKIWTPVIKVDKDPQVEFVNVWMFYPDDSVSEFGKANDSIELHPYSALDLKRLCKHPGFISESIEKVLEEKPEEYNNTRFVAYTELTEGNPYLFKNKYQVLEYNGPILKEKLDKLGIECPYESVNGEYYGEVWVCNNRIIRIELENIEASYELPYGVSVYNPDPNSIFGFGLPIIIRDAQRVAATTWHMILDNASIASGPQIAMHKGFVEPADGKWELAPRKAWYLTDPMVKVSDAIEFFYPPDITENLLPVLEMARRFADEESGIPMTLGSIESPAASETASGQLIRAQQGTIQSDFLSEEWDCSITEKMIRRVWAWNMQYNKDDSIKGNFTIDVRTSTEYRNKIMHLRDLERLALEAAQNPEMAIIINGQRLSRARLAMMGIPFEGIVRSETEVEEMKKQAEENQPPNPEIIKLQIEQQKLEVEKAKLGLEQQEMEFQRNQQQQREAWEHEEKMAANYARLIEAQAMVLRTQNEKDTQLLQIAARVEDANERRRIMEQAQERKDNITVFLKTMEQTGKARDQVLTQEELRLAQRTGEGI